LTLRDYAVLLVQRNIHASALEKIAVFSGIATDATEEANSTVGYGEMQRRWF